METISSKSSEVACKENNDADASCVLIETDTTVIEIKDEIDSTEDFSKNPVSDELPSEYEILDQTFGSDSVEVVSVNGSQESSSQIETPTKSKSSEKFLVDIKFRNKKTYFSLHEDFIDVIKRCFKNKLDDLNIIDDAAGNRLCVAEKLVKKSEAFLIDTTPTVDVSSLESTPRYTSLSKNVLTFERVQDDDEKKSTPSSHKCFNCGKPHSLRDCPEPRNMSKIRKARNEFNRKELRYLDDENEFSKFTPGQISEDLKTALGVTSNQVPLHVYKMRRFGYPPAWLEEAKLYNSGLSLFVEKDKVQSHEEENRPYKFDVQKIYNFPGFNVAPEQPFVDKHRLIGLPPMQHRDSKEVFIQSLGDVVINGYKKRKIRDIGSSNDAPSSSRTEADMEIEGSGSEDEVSIVPLPPGIEADRPQSPDEEGEISNESPASPTEDELQNERNQLLAELNSSNVESQPKTSTQLMEETILENSVNENLDNSSREESSIQLGHVETTLFGATVLPSFTPFDSLPAGEKFKEGVCDVIAFENLTESTGKYEKMKSLIKKVRVVLKDHKDD